MPEYSKVPVGPVPGDSSGNIINSAVDIHTVPFNRSFFNAAAQRAMLDVLAGGSLAGGGAWTTRCHRQIAAALGSGAPFLTTSGTSALEMGALLMGIAPGDEVIMPSWTFSSTANAVALRGATPVFVDVDPRDLNIDPACVAAAITDRTSAVICVHYAGTLGDMTALAALCEAHGLKLMEDAAQAYGSSLDGRAAGTIGDFAAFSFHGTKNIGCGEGGALIVNDPDLVAYAEIAWEKGTNRMRYQRGEVEWYNWADLGSSFLPSDLLAALLSTQLTDAEATNAARVRAWDRYDALLSDAATRFGLQTLTPAPGCVHNGHIYAVRVPASVNRERLMAAITARGVDVRSHYQPLHLAPAGKRFGRAAGSLAVSEAVGRDLFRLPIDALISDAEQDYVVAVLIDELGRMTG